MFLRKRNANPLVILILILIGFTAGVLINQYKAPVEKYMFFVDEVIDGDTILIETGDYVRLIGINAPEKDEELYNESKAFLESLVLDKVVIIKQDVEDKDNYGRLLRYVYLNNLSVNIEMVKQGYARPMHIEPDTSQKDKIDSAWQECLKNKINLCQT